MVLSPALLCLAPASQAAGDPAAEYLRWIEAEAKRQATTSLMNPDATAPGLPADTDRLPLGLQRREDFEKALREQFAGTYAFYQRLSSAGKEQIFQAYRQDNRVSAIREQTLQLLAGGSP
jgi:hypothetical protein